MKAPSYMSPTERPRGGDHAGGEAPVVAVAQHDRQRYEAHGNHRGRNYPGGCGEQRTDEDHGEGEPAAQRTEHLADGVEQVLGHAASLQNQSHESEERNREQRVVGHHGPDALRQRLKERRLKQPELDSSQAEEDADRSERERDRIADQQEEHQRREHQRRHVVGQEFDHAEDSRCLRNSSASCSSRLGPTSFSVGSGISPRRNAMRLISSESPCRTSRRKPTGTISRAGQMIKPPALVEISLLRYASTNTGQDSHMMVIAMGRRNSSVPNTSIQAWTRLDSCPTTRSIRTCWLCRSV